MKSNPDNYLDTLQAESRKCLEKFLRACEENNLQYYLFWGSLIGAVRHKGFIPWDDDIDIIMPRKDYEKFISLYGSHFTEDFFLDGYNCAHYLNNQPNCRIDFKHLYIRKERDNGTYSYNAFISLFPIDGVPDNLFLRRIHIFRLKLLYNLLRLSRSARNGTDKLEKRNTMDKLLIKIFKVLPIGRLLPPKKIVSWYNKLSSKYDYTTKAKSIVSWNFKMFDSVLLIEGDIADFDGLKCKIPRGWDTILRSFYGDYMTLPPERDRKPHHGFELVQC